MDIERLISIFLKLGYVPDEHLDFETLSVIKITNKSNDYNDKNYYTNLEDSIEMGAKILSNTFEDLISPGKLNVIPLSGGLDSRAILGALLKIGLKDDIVTVTYGIPGTLDYEIGKDLAKTMGIKHEAIDLRSIEINQERLIRVAQETDIWTWIFDSFYNNIIYEEFGKDAVYWSGFMGGVTGSNLFEEDSTDNEMAIARFIKRNSMVKSNILISPEISLQEELQQIDFDDNSRLNLDEQLHGVVRQESYIKPTLIKEGYHINIFNLEEDWLRFILNAPKEFRLNQILYKEILLQLYPKLFSFKTKTNYGLGLNSSKTSIYLQKCYLGSKYLFNKIFTKNKYKPTINYIDFSEAILNRTDFKNLVKDNIRDLKGRDIINWIDIDDILKKHLNKNHDYGMELILLTALELNFKAKEFLYKTSEK